jgi:hypothetical protein
MLLKALLCVVEENATPAENAGRLKAEEIAEVMRRIDAGKGRKEGTRNDLEGQERWGSGQCRHLHRHGRCWR